MQIDTDDMVTATEMNRNASRYLTEISDGNRNMFVVMKDNVPTACIVGLERMKQLQQLEEREQDLKLLALSLVRVATDTGERHDLDDIIAELGIEED